MLNTNSTSGENDQRSSSPKVATADCCVDDEVDEANETVSEILSLLSKEAAQEKVSSDCGGPKKTTKLY